MRQYPCPSPQSMGCFISVRNYAWNARCIRQWLFLNNRRWHEGGSRWQRMEHAVKMTLVAVLFGESILIHCRQGKHRSGTVACFMYCLLCGCTLNDALPAYRSCNRRVVGRDIGIVRDIWDKNNLTQALEYFREQGWVQNMVGNILHKVFVPTVPRPLSAPSRTTAARARSRSPQPRKMPKSRPQPQAASSSGAASSSDAASSGTPVAEIIDLEAPVDCPQSDVYTHATERAEADVVRERTPSPTRGRRLAWTCGDCGNLNNRTYTVCSRVGCGGRLPHLQRSGDWPCLDCGHMNRSWRDHCNWSHCPSNDWVCPACGNLNFGDRRFCNRKSPPCSEPRPMSLR